MSWKRRRSVGNLQERPAAFRLGLGYGPEGTLAQLCGQVDGLGGSSVSVPDLDLSVSVESTGRSRSDQEPELSLKPKSIVVAAP